MNFFFRNFFQNQRGVALADPKFVEGSLWKEVCGRKFVSALLGGEPARPPIHTHIQNFYRMDALKCVSCILGPSIHLCIGACTCILATRVKLLLSCKFRTISFLFHRTKRNPSFLYNYGKMQMGDSTETCTCQQGLLNKSNIYIYKGITS